MTTNAKKTAAGAKAARTKTVAKPEAETVPGKLYEYYRDLSLLPTFGDLQDEAALDQFGRIRVDLFDNKLFMPLRLFDGADLLHVGPDSGEHSLVFGKWGANLTLVEPNAIAVNQIKEYFKRFKMEDRVKAIFETDLAGFSTDQRFDIVDAEGFIYTLQPASNWLSAFRGVLKDGGLLVVSYYARLGGFFELFLRAMHRSVHELTGKSAEESAWMLFEAKWNSIPHDKPFKFWVLDMLDNPYVRLRYFLDPGKLCREVEEHGFTLYSSWPFLRDPLEAFWHKRIVADDDRMDDIPHHLARSCLSHFTGRKMYMTTTDPRQVKEVIGLLNALVVQADALIDGLDDVVLTRCIELLRELGAMIPSLSLLTDHPDTMPIIVALLAKVEKAIRFISNGDVDSLTRLTNNDSDFIHTWGLPTHFAVYRKTDA